MKSFLAVFTALVAFAGSVNASVTINLVAGDLRDSTDTVLSSTITLWALVQDDGDGQLPGGLGLNESLTTGDASTAYADFAGQTIEVDNLIGNDRIFAVGQGTDLNGVAVFPVEINPDLGSNSLVAGNQYALYWFVGLDLGSNTIPSTSFEIGGLNETALLIDTGTTIPSEGASLNTTLLSQNQGGLIPDARFTSIFAVPEPSSALLGLLGLGLLRRRR